MASAKEAKAAPERPFYKEDGAKDGRFFLRENRTNKKDKRIPRHPGQRRKTAGQVYIFVLETG